MNLHLGMSAKRNGTQRRIKVRYVHCMYCAMSKSTCQAETTSNSEKIKPVSLAVIKLQLPEGISQSVSQWKNSTIKFFVVATFGSVCFRSYLRNFRACFSTIKVL